jgi:hypothetical protein
VKAAVENGTAPHKIAAAHRQHPITKTYSCACARKPNGIPTLCIQHIPEIAKIIPIALMFLMASVLTHGRTLFITKAPFGIARRMADGLPERVMPKGSAVILLMDAQHPRI